MIVDRPRLLFVGTVRMFPALPVIVLVLVAVALFMLAELQLSLANERRLRARGAVEPGDDVYPVMRIAYPLAFVLMGIEAALGRGLPFGLVVTGLVLLGAAKALKLWAIASLGSRWSFRVLVPPDAALVTTGPYRLLRHPNYVAVLGELLAVAVTLAAPVTGAIALIGFGWILWKRIQVEERVLGYRHE